MQILMVDVDFESMTTAKQISMVTPLGRHAILQFRVIMGCGGHGNILILTLEITDSTMQIMHSLVVNVAIIRLV